MSVANGEDESCEDNGSSSSSPLASLPGDFRAALDAFRNDWQRELNGTVVNGSPTVTTEMQQQELAESLFRKAVELEQCGKVYDALPLYRRATQMVPDIELKYYERQQLNSSNETQRTAAVEENLLENSEPTEYIDLSEKFQLDLAKDYNGRLLLSNHDPGVISTELHFSDLPPEIINYILRWVISSQLDMRSLEQCSAVCKGLYLCARDEKLWRSACIKVWGMVNLQSSVNSDATKEIEENENYTSWRQMFIEKQRVHFNGCYISKTTYLRQGENSFQDQYYRPVQYVEYYRYLRFLSDGTCLMMTSADEPAQGVTKLNNIHQWRSDVLRGHYEIIGNNVNVCLVKQQQQPKTQTKGRRGNTPVIDDTPVTEYCMELRIVSTSKRKFAKLIWQHYSVVQTRNTKETINTFVLTPAKYPPLLFSIVRSYHLNADSPLI